MALDLWLFGVLHSLAGVSYAGDRTIVFFAEHFPFIVGGALIVFLFFSAYPRMQQIHFFCIAVISALIARVAIVEIIRHFIHRPRPFEALHFQPLIPESSWSFPSGHATFFFAFAMAIYMYNKKWGIWFFSAALVISVARVIAGVHYPSDILGGAIVGVIVAYVIVRGTRYFEISRRFSPNTD